MSSESLRKTLIKVASFYDRRKVGDVGPLGFRRSSDLGRMVACLDKLIDRDILVPRESLFLDLGCADGRVNVLLSYLVKVSVGIEIDEWTLEEFDPLKADLEAGLKKDSLPLPPDNIYLFHGDSTDDTLHENIHKKTGVSFEEFDLFYTYLTMYEEFSRLIARKAKKGAVFMVYGLEKIMPKLQGFHLLTPDSPMEGLLALYQKN